MNFPVQYESCPCRTESYRLSVLNLLDEFDKENVGTKSGIVKSYLELSPILKEKFSKGKIKICKSCGEPAANDECQTCRILNIIKS